MISLEGGMPDLPSELPMRKIERSFGALMHAIQKSDLVITPDSLQGHCANYHGVPAFVNSPIPKQYWLPRTCFLEDSWALFRDYDRLRSWLDRHIGQQTFAAVRAPA